MNKYSVKYRDTWAAPGSQLFEALMANDMQRAERIYRECEAERVRLEGRVWQTHNDPRASVRPSHYRSPE